MKMIFAEVAKSDQPLPRYAVTAVASLETVGDAGVLVTYYVADDAGDRAVVELQWDNSYTWVSMGGAFNRARAMIAAQHAGAWDRERARDAVRREGMALIRSLAGPEVDGETVKARIARTAGLLPGWKVDRIEDIWRGEARRPEAWEMDQLRALAFPSLR